jgi:DNA-binding winged helix-turn-helix (wHTH) protein
MLERIAARFREELGEEQIQRALRLAGGHPGLLRAGFRLAREASDDLSAAFTHYPEILEECQRIWRSLPEDEQRALLGLAALPAPILPAAELLARLREKGLVGGAWRAPGAIFSLLFEAFIRQVRPAAGAHVTIDRARRVVWVDGRSIEDLSPLEFSFLEYLLQHRGEVCSRDDLARHLYGDEGPALAEGQPKKGKGSSADREKISGVSDEMLDSIVKRLRKALEIDPNHPPYILTVRGIGFRLADSAGPE